MNRETEQLILGNYYTLEMCRKEMNRCAHIYLNNTEVAKRYNEVKKNLELVCKQETEQLQKIEEFKREIAFKTKVLKSDCQNLSEEPITKKGLKIAQTELSAMEDTLKAIQEKKTMLRHTIIALLQYQTEEQVFEETERAKEKYLKILINYNKFLDKLNKLSGTSYSPKSENIEMIDQICLEQLLGEECEHEQH